MEDGVGGLQIWDNATSAWQDVKPVPGTHNSLTQLTNLRFVCCESRRYDIQVDTRYLQNYFTSSY
jgi:hypothetical protein